MVPDLSNFQKHLAIFTKHRLPVPRFLQLLETSIQFAGFGSFSRKKVLEFALRLGWSRWWTWYIYLHEKPIKIQQM